MDVSFPGIFTLNRTGKKQAVKCKKVVEELCFSLQQHIFAMLVEVPEWTMGTCGQTEDILCIGEVRYNPWLKHRLTGIANYLGGRAFCTDERYSIYNGTMIAWTSSLMLQEGWKISFTCIEKATFTQRYRTDNVFVKWKWRALTIVDTFEWLDCKMLLNALRQ